MNRKNALLILSVALAGGSIPAFGKLALEAFEPFTLVFFRFAAASVVIYYFLPKKELSIKILKDLKWIALIGAGNPIFFFVALQYLPSNIIPLFYAIVPGLGVAYLWLSQKGRPSNIQLLGFATGLAGVAIISQGTVNSNQDGNTWLGLGLMSIAVFAFFAYGLMSKEQQRSQKISGTALAFYFTAVTAIVSAPIAGYEMVSSSWLSDIELKHVLSVLYLGFVGTGAQYLLFQKALEVMEAAYANLFTYIQPVVGIVLGFLILGETVTTQLILGGTIVLVGARMALTQQKQKTRRKAGS